MDANALKPKPNPGTPSAAAVGAAARWRLADLQALPQDAFEEALAEAVEHAPWVARRAWAARPFENVVALVQAMRQVILRATVAEQTVLLRGHPELAGAEARAGQMTADSTTEQGRLGLDRLDTATLAQVESLNRRYRDRFGFPLIVALRLHADLASVLRDAEARLANDPGDERLVALQQVGEVMSGRLRRLVVGEVDVATPADVPSPVSPHPSS